MIGCNVGRCFQVTVAGGSYQEGLTSVLQGVPPGLLLSEQEIYGDLLLRKPGADELSSPRKEPDLPIIFSGLNVADTIEDAGNKNHTNGTPLCILIIPTAHRFASCCPTWTVISSTSNSTRTRTAPLGRGMPRTHPS
jgi:chorismate synthase